MSNLTILTYNSGSKPLGPVIRVTNEEAKAILERYAKAFPRALESLTEDKKDEIQP